MARKPVVRGMSVNSGQIPFLNTIGTTAVKLSLEQFCEVLCASKQDQAARVGIEPMSRPRALQQIDVPQNILKRISVKPPAGVHGKRGGFIHDKDRFILMNDLDVRVHIGFTCHRLDMQVAFARPHEIVESDGYSGLIGRTASHRGR